jgi:hypothetical protein
VSQRSVFMIATGVAVVLAAVVVADVVGVVGVVVVKGIQTTLVDLSRGYGDSDSCVSKLARLTGNSGSFCAHTLAHGLNV